MTPGQLIDLLEKAGMLKEESPGVLGWHPTMQKAERFAALVAAAEREKVAAWMVERSYATGHGDTTEDLLKELEWQVRESCVRVCEEKAQQYRDRAARPEGERDIDPKVARIATLTCEFVADAILEKGQA